MKKTILFICISLLLYACTEGNKASNASDPTPTQTEKQPFAIVIHGGAGTILKENISDSMELAYKTVLEQSVRMGYKILNDGGSSLDAVEACIRILEDSPLFNAGKGAVFTNNATNELDASIMEGRTKNAGAVAGVTTIKNPITLARAVMEQSEHVMLAREGAEEFAKQVGVTLVDPEYFYTESRMKALKVAQNKNSISQTSLYDPYAKDDKFGTVGCVALDKEGNIAAGTSTGGMNNKRWGRIGDSPVIGAGTYANNRTCGISATGWGEYFIRGVVAYDISAMMEYANLGLNDAAHKVIHEKLPEMGGDGGIIGIDHMGNIAMVFNTPGMFRASIDKTGDLSIKLYSED
ncbi:L-asparaginase [Galbibacter marinus]|uniref:Isoaspartyl peptidase n=1 Tax=Galbibacter marinus TaxID=555500 RepID=K2QK76_9FLAO|nr:isoaspartyl peptidase/L-asparaginase [Galbibacter marinus]EKF55112.1 L-asparaginase [Galbibacter marinus]